MAFNIPIGADATEFNKTIDASERRVEQLAKRSAEITGTTEKAARLSFNRVLGSARVLWSAVDQVFQAMGINMGEQMRLLLQSGFSAISAMHALYSAQATNPFTAAFGIFSLVELGFAITAMVQAQMGQQEAATQTAKTARALFAVGNFVNSISFL